MNIAIKKAEEKYDTILILADSAKIFAEESRKMTTVSMFEAKINLSGYVASIAIQQEPYVVITRNGKPDAKSFRL